MPDLPPQIDVAIAGATGVVGQRFVELLQDHPWFNLTAMAASDRNVGKNYTKAAKWLLTSELWPKFADMPLVSLDELKGAAAPALIFSALPSETANDAETELASAGKAVFTNAAAHRMDAEVPLLIPEVNRDHLHKLENRITDGFIVANANCSSIMLTIGLAALHKKFGLNDVNVFTQQALSGAGHPGVSALDIVDNIIPYIKNEEEKLEEEPAKMLGTATEPADITIVPTATRVNVSDGHLITVHTSLKQDTELEDIYYAWADTGLQDMPILPSSLSRLIHIFEHESDRPQPRLDRDTASGMAISIGRARKVGAALRFVILGHNTIRGAAGQSVLNAELAYKRGFINIS